MAINKLSINEIGVHQGLAQIKTGEFFIVTALDLDAKKATLKSVSGEEKVVSKATLERWYRTLEPEEAIKLGKMLRENSNGGSDDEVHEQGESAPAEEPGKGEDADGGDAVQEDDAVANASQEEAVPAGAENEGNDEGAGERVSETAGGDRESAEDVSGEPVESDVEPGNGGGETVGEPAGDGEDPEVKSPVTPSNAGKDKDKAKAPKKQEPKNAALMKVRQTIIDTILADSDSIQLKQTTSYDVLKEKHNFAEITHGSNRFNVSVMSESLTEDQLSKVKVNPASFGWSIDADFTVFDESDIEMAVQLIRQSREYRLAHPVTRKKKAAEAKK